jgi:hypothetical protein
MQPGTRGPRWIVAEQSNVTAAGKQLQLDRWDLESLKVR